MCRERMRRGRSRWPTLPPGKRPARVHHQGLPERPVLGVPRLRAQGGDRLELTGPFGVFTLRDAPTLTWSSSAAGRARAILCLLRSMAERGHRRKAVSTTGRAQRDLCSRPSCAALESALPGFRYVPASPMSSGTAKRPDHRRRTAAGRPPTRAHAYVCGPPRCRGSGAAARPTRRARKARVLRQVHVHRGDATMTTPERLQPRTIPAQRSVPKCNSLTRRPG